MTTEKAAPQPKNDTAWLENPLVAAFVSPNVARSGQSWRRVFEKRGATRTRPRGGSATYPLLSLCIVAASLAGCGGSGGGGWALEEQADPISGAKTAIATRRFSLDGEPAVVADVALSCRAAGANNPFALFVEVTAYNAQARNGTLPPVRLTSQEFEYRLDPLGSGVAAPTKRLEQTYNNQFRTTFVSLVAGSPTISKAVLSEMEKSRQSEWTVVALRMAALAAQSERDKMLSAAVAELADDPGSQPMMRGPMAAATGNYRWAFQTLTLRFRAQNDEGVANEYVIEAPLDAKEVLQVAEACGWSRNALAPAAAPVPADTASQAVNTTVAAAPNVELVIDYGAKGEPEPFNMDDAASEYAATVDAALSPTLKGRLGWMRHLCQNPPRGTEDQPITAAAITEIENNVRAAFYEALKANPDATTLADRECVTRVESGQGL